MLLNYQIQLPQSIDLDEQEFRFLVASKLLETGKLSMSQAAELSGKTYRAFMESLAQYNIQWLNYSEENLSKDVETLKTYLSRR